MVRGKEMAAKNIQNLDRLVLYLVKETEQTCLSHQSYSLVLLDSNTDGSNWPGFRFVRHMSSKRVLGAHHTDNLKAFLVVHPSLRFRYTAMAMQVLEPKIWKKVVYLNTTAQLQHYIPR